MQQTFKLRLATFPYAGNSSGSSMAHDVTEWLLRVQHLVRTDAWWSDRLELSLKSYNDTPIPMTRNRCVRECQQEGIDYVLMVDSDMRPDCEVGQDALAQPFFQTAMKYLMETYHQGPRVIAAPYGGAPPHENMFVFKWRGIANLGKEQQFSLEQYTREEAAAMAGIQECAALPTGLIVYDMRAFELIKPPWFFYEYTDDYQQQKASTEDVTNTRDISLNGQIRLGYNPCMCAWDCWAGHLKVWCVRKPRVLTSRDVSENLREAAGTPTAIEWSNPRFANIKAENEGQYSGNGEKPTATPTATPQRVQGKTMEEGADLINARMCETPQVHKESLGDVIREYSRANEVPCPSVVEVGTWIGDTARYCLEHTNCQWTAVDSFHPAEEWTGTIGQVVDLEALWRENLANFPGCKLLVGLEEEMAEQVEDGSADLIILDADHSYRAVVSQISRWWPKLKRNGLMLVHDYSTQNFPGVTEACDQCFGTSRIMVIGDLHDNWGYAMVQKKTDGPQQAAFRLLEQFNVS